MSVFTQGFLMLASRKLTTKTTLGVAMTVTRQFCLEMSHALDATEMWADSLFTSQLFCAAVRQLFFDTEREFTMFHLPVFH